MGQLWSMKPLNVDFEIPGVPALPGDIAMASGFCPSVLDIVWYWSQQTNLLLQGHSPPLVCHSEICLWWLSWEHQSHHWGWKCSFFTASVCLLIYWAAFVIKLREYWFYMLCPDLHWRNSWSRRLPWLLVCLPGC